MGAVRRKLLVKTIGVTFLTVALLLVVVFVVVTLSVRDQVRRAVTGNLESSQRTFSALETRRQREMQAQAATLAENPTLKAALDTYQAETPSPPMSWRTQLIETIDRELGKVATRAESDALVLVDAHQVTIAAAGRLADRWPRGRSVALATSTAGTASTDRPGDRRALPGRRRAAAVRRWIDDRDVLCGDERRPEVRRGTGASRGDTDCDRQRRPGVGQHSAYAGRAQFELGRREAG